jgi:ADP-ribosylglycohydrolase
MNAAAPAPALPASYWAEPDRLLAGEHPGDADPVVAAARIGTLLDAGIDYFLDLTWPDELPDYAPLLPSPYASGPRRAVMYSRRPIRDHALPDEPLQMVEILDELDDALRGGHRVYVHCRAGIGRTGTVVGCWLARRLGSGDDALAALETLWRNAERDRDYPRTPETEAQVEYVRQWQEGGRAPSPPDPAAAWLAPAAPALARAPGPTPVPAASTPAPPRPAPPLLGPTVRASRYHGLVHGLAIGDALGMPLEGSPPQEMQGLLDFAAGGPFELPAGAWTDDTALALLLAESLLETGRNDGRDQVARYARWLREGYGSSTGRAVGAGPTTARAVAQAQWTGNPRAGPHDPAKADKDPMSRAAIAAAWAAADPERAVALAAEVARPTHQAPQTLDACRYYAGLVVGALQGASRQELLAPDFSPVPGLWERHPLRREVAAVAAGGWRRTAPGGGGRAVDALAAVLWALERGPGWREAVLAAVSLGQDTTTSGALVGALAGALYGVGAIPPHWVAGVARADWLASTAERLSAAAEPRPSGP